MAPVAPPASLPSRFSSLDVVRGLCAAVVFLSHWFLWSDFPPRSPATAGLHRAGELLHEAFTALVWPTGGVHPAVICFLVLSGFCIHHPVAVALRRGTAARSWRDYFRRRFWRIMPVYWTAAALGLVFALLERAHPSGNALLAFHAGGSLVDFLVRLAGVSAVYPREIIAGNLTLNTVGTELLLYLAYPLLLAATCRVGWLAVGLFLFGLQLLSLPLLAAISSFWLFNSALMLGAYWYLGAFVAQLAADGKLRLARSAPLFAWAVFLLLKIPPYFYGQNFLKQSAWAITCALGIGWLVARETRAPATAAPRGLFFGVFRYLGDISYSLYAIHTPVMLLGSWALLVLARRDAYFSQLVVLLLTSAAASLAVHYGIERRFRAAPRPPASAPALAAALSAPPR